MSTGGWGSGNWGAMPWGDEVPAFSPIPIVVPVFGPAASRSVAATTHVAAARVATATTPTKTLTGTAQKSRRVG